MKSALGIMLLLTAQVEAIPFTYRFTGGISDVDVVGLDDFEISRNSALPPAGDTPARDQLEQTDVGGYGALGLTLSSDGLALASAVGALDVWVQHTTLAERRTDLRRLLRAGHPTRPNPNSQAKSANGKSPVSNNPAPKRAKPKKNHTDVTGVVPVPDFGGTALLFLLSSGLLIAINHRRSPRRRSL